MDLDSQLCFCFHIKKRKIVNFVKQTRPRRASQISECFGAGTGCGWCIPFLKRIHRQIVAGDIVEADDVSAAEYEMMRSRYLEGIRDGSIERNTPATEEPPIEPPVAGCALGAAAIDVAGSDRNRDTVDPRSSDADAEGDWDVSDAFSRKRTPEPEPDLLTDEFLAGMEDDDDEEEEENDEEDDA